MLQKIIKLLCFPEFLIFDDGSTKISEKKSSNKLFVKILITKTAEIHEFLINSQAELPNFWETNNLKFMFFRLSIGPASKTRHSGNIIIKNVFGPSFGEPVVLF